MSEFQAAVIETRNYRTPRAGHLHDGSKWARQVVDAIAQAKDEVDNEFFIRVVDDSSRRLRASSLIERRYAWRGYRSSPLDSNPTSQATLTACVDEATVATITAGLDSQRGLYVAKLYPDEVQSLQGEGRKLCEFTKLAVDETVRSRAVLGAIFHAAFLYVMKIHGCTDVLIEVNPRHVRFYQRMLGFKRVGGERIDVAVNAPAVLLRLDLSHATSEIARLGGRRNSKECERSFYPYFFAPDEADKIVSRLRGH